MSTFWKIQYKVDGEMFQVICMRKSYAASIIRTLIKKGIAKADLTIVGPAEEIEAYERAIVAATK